MLSSLFIYRCLFNNKIYIYEGLNNTGVRIDKLYLPKIYNNNSSLGLYPATYRYIKKQN